MNAKILFAAGLALLVAGCAGIPTEPSLLALPGTGKSLNDFRSSDAQCRQYASQQIIVATGPDTVRVGGYGAQSRYDNAYVQCMYAAGHKVPVTASLARSLIEQAPAANVPSGAAAIPPPPPHAPPASPPPDYVAPTSVK